MLKYQNEYKGINSRLDEIQAAFLNIKLKHLDDDNEARRAIADIYLNNISNPQIILPAPPLDKNAHVWHIFPIRTNDRERLQEFLKNRDINTMVHYPIPPHKQRAFKEWNHLSFPVTELIHEQILSLPISPVLTKEEAETIAEAVDQYEK